MKRGFHFTHGYLFLSRAGPADLVSQRYMLERQIPIAKPRCGSCCRGKNQYRQVKQVLYQQLSPVPKLKLSGTVAQVTEEPAPLMLPFQISVPPTLYNWLGYAGDNICANSKLCDTFTVFSFSTLNKIPPEKLLKLRRDVNASIVKELVFMSKCTSIYL